MGGISRRVSPTFFVLIVGVVLFAYLTQRVMLAFANTERLSSVRCPLLAFCIFVFSRTTGKIENQTRQFCYFGADQSSNMAARGCDLV